MPGRSPRGLLALSVFALCFAAALADSSAVAHGAKKTPPEAWHHGETGDLAADLEAIRKTEHRLRYLVVAGHRKREMALTFDDGPSPYTSKLLRVLRKMKVPATFFQIGSQINSFARVEKSLINDPDVYLADHTQHHPDLTLLSYQGQYGEIADTARTQLRHGAPWPHLMRPPYGAFDGTTLRVAHNLHMLTVLWTIDPRDWSLPGTSAIVDRVVGAAEPGAIALMHDGGGDRSETVAAVPTIVHRLRAAHYRLVTVPRLLRDDPPSTNQPPRSGAD
jgi:peptidoglycan/xylan/chitin deacetylase (PgdA/CDA1 family)